MLAYSRCIVSRFRPSVDYKGAQYRRPSARSSRAPYRTSKMDPFRVPRIATKYGSALDDQLNEHVVVSTICGLHRTTTDSR